MTNGSKTKIGTEGEYWIGITIHHVPYQKSKGKLGGKNEGKACEVGEG